MTPAPSADGFGPLRSLSVAVAAQTCSMLPVYLTGALAPFLMADLGMTALGLGSAVALFYAASALSSMILAPLADRMGVWSIARLAFVALILACLGMAGISVRVWIVFALLALAGLANGCIHPTTNVIVSRFVPARRQGAAYGIKQSAVPVATMLGGLAVPLIGMTIGWRWGFGMAAGLTLTLLLLTPRGGDLPQTGPRGRITTARRPLILLALMSGFGAATANAMAAFLVPSIVAQGHAPAIAGTVMAAGSLLAIAVRISLGFAADRFLLPLLGIAAVLFAGGAVSYMIFATTGSLPLIVLATLLTFGMGWGWSGLTILAIARANSGAVGAATGITQGCVFVGAVIGPAAFGALVDQFSYAVAWQLMAAMGAAATICALLAAQMLATERRDAIG